MFDTYITAAMKYAQYKWLPEDKLWFAEVPPLHGVWAATEKREDLDDELRSVIEGWVEVGLRHGDPIPELDGVTVPPLPPTERWTPEELVAMEEENRQRYDQPDSAEVSATQVSRDSVS